MSSLWNFLVQFNKRAKKPLLFFIKIGILLTHIQALRPALSRLTYSYLTNIVERKSVKETFKCGIWLIG